MNSAAGYIVSGLNLKLPEKLKSKIEDINTVCCLSGKPITRGIQWRFVIPSSTGEYLDLLHGMSASGYMSIEAATAYKGSWNMGSRLIFEDGTMYHPFIARKSAQDSPRPCWSDLIRDIWESRRGQKCLCVVASDYKKKVWPRARIGTLGTNTPVLLFDTDRHILQNLNVDWSRLIQVLDIVERVHTYGFSKPNIAENLFGDYKNLCKDVQLAADYEQELVLLRPLPEFKIAVLVAQKETKKI